MEHWEFLLQKDGDRSWLPLDSPSVEILEGRYRIVVRSSQPNTEVMVRISHLNSIADPPKRRLQKRSSRTNQDGLMVLIPYTRLEPGIWGFHCSSGDLLSELVGVPWEYTVQLQVIAQESEVEEWESDWAEGDSEAEPLDPVASSVAPVAPALSPPESLAPEQSSLAPIPEPASEPTSPPPADSIQLDSSPAVLSQSFAEASEASVVAAPEKLVDSQPATNVVVPNRLAEPSSSPDPAAAELHYLTEQLSDELIDEVMQEFDLLDLPEPFLRSTLDLAESAPRLGTAAPSSDTAITPQPAFRLTFDQDAFVARQSETLTLTGTIQGQQAGDPAIGEIADPWDSTGKLPQPQPQARSLQLYLRDPQTLEVLVSHQQPLPAPAQTFSLCFTLPAYLDTRLILGEVQLYESKAESKAQVLATQTFAITVNPLDLVQELTRINTALNQPKQPQSEPAESPQPLQPSQPVSLDLSFLASATPLPAPPAKTYSLGGQPLPPQLYHPDSTLTRPSGLHLPDFTSAPPDSAQPDRTSLPPIKPEAGQEEVVGTIDPAEELDGTPAIESPPAPATDPEDSVIDSAESITVAASAETKSTLEAIPEAETPEVPVESSAFRALNLHDRFLTRLNALAGESDSKPEPQTESALTWISPPSSSEDSERMADEVVNDESSARSRSRNKPTQPGVSETVGEATDASNPLVLSPDEPVPTPDLQVTSGELVAGKLVNIRVRLPNLLPRIYVKLWINDRQTRSLLEGPRWLVNLLPNGHGALEATTQLLVPLGSLDVRFEAIAVEVQTQRESHKVSVDRSVIPPDLPALSLQDSLNDLVN